MFCDPGLFNFFCIKIIYLSNLIIKQVSKNTQKYTNTCGLNDCNLLLMYINKSTTYLG